MWRVSEEVLALPKCQTVETNSTQSPPLTSSACAGMPFHVSSPSFGPLRPSHNRHSPAFFFQKVGTSAVPHRPERWEPAMNFVGPSSG
eukprot:COSAG04_NODE_1047_length_8562_cov_9.403167_18_plen_88_part_00